MFTLVLHANTPICIDQLHWRRLWFETNSFRISIEVDQHRIVCLFNFNNQFLSKKLDHFTYPCYIYVWNGLALRYDHHLTRQFEIETQKRQKVERQCRNCRRPRRCRWRWSIFPRFRVRCRWSPLSPATSRQRFARKLLFCDQQVEIFLSLFHNTNSHSQLKVIKWLQ